MGDARQERIEAAEARVKALFESLADLLDVPNSGKWYQLSAYLKSNPDGTTDVYSFGAFPVYSGRTLRLIDMGRGEPPPPPPTQGPPSRKPVVLEELKMADL